MSRRLLAAGLAAVTVAAGVTLAPGAGADELPALSDSPLVLKAPKKMTVRSHGGWVYSGLEIRLVAQHENFQINANRPSWDDPISAVWKRETGDVPLPDGSMTTWQGLDAFTRVVLDRTDGRKRRIRMTGCFNSYSQERVDPRGPVRSPYPYGCPWNAFTVGSVMGIAEGYRSPLWSDWSGPGLRLRPGTYEVRASIPATWRDFFGISRQDGVATSTLVVRKGRDWGRTANRSAAPARAAAHALQPATDEPTADAAGVVDTEFAPDLRSLPAFGIALNARGTALRFGANVWNGGNGPLVVDGFRTEGTDHMDAYQYFLDGSGEQVGYQRVGEMHWHGANHNHWHFEDFARYRLLKANDDGSTGPAVRSNKRSFCLANTDAIDYTVPNADWQPDGTDLSTACGGRRAMSVREVLSNGSGDTYYQYRAGQAFRVGNLPDGVYYIAVEANPLDRKDGRNLVETSYENNDSLRKIRITHNKRGERVVRVPQVGIIDEEQFGFFRR